MTRTAVEERTMPRKKKVGSSSTDEKKKFAEEWMQANKEKLTVQAVNDAIKEKFGSGMGVVPISNLVRAFRGTTPSAAQGPKTAGRPRLAKQKAAKKKTAAVALPKTQPTARAASTADVLVHFAPAVQDAFTTLRKHGITAVELPPGGPTRVTM
jgi:hypothetical protein